MSISPDKIKALIQALALTRQEEGTCSECLRDLATFAENELQGKSVPETLQMVKHHLTLCGECNEEYEALLRALEENE